MIRRHSRVAYRLCVSLLVVLSVTQMAGAQHAWAQDNPWRKLADGLDLGHFKVAEPSVAGDSTIVILRIDPAEWELKLVSASEMQEPYGMTAKEWCDKYHLIAAINAGMFQKDHRTHVGYMKSRNHVNCAHRAKYLSAAAFDPLRPGLPPFRIFDLDHDNLDSVAARYGSVSQNIRMINRNRDNRWSLQPKKWSEVALGEDDAGRVLFIFCRSPYPMHDFDRLLLSLPIGLVCAQHLEGGPEASLYLHWGDEELEFSGSYETVFTENDNNHTAWPIPNIIGVVRKD